MSPEQRPSFKEISLTLSKSIERVAGYLEIGFNPFTTGGRKGGEMEEKVDGEEEEEGPSGVMINIIPSSA